MNNEQIKKVAFIDVWYGTPKGHSYVNRDLMKIIGEKCETHMYRIGDNPLPVDFMLPDGRFDAFVPNAMTKVIEIPKVEFEKWLDEVQPDYCIFNEYNQWWDTSYDKLDICKKRGIKAIGYLVWERLDWTKLNHYRKYWKIIVPSKFQTKLMRKKGLYNTIHFKYGVFFDEIDKVVQPPKSEKTIFYHCAGSGGVGDRKNTAKIIEAYRKVEDKTTELRITHLSKKVFGRDEILAFTKGADVLVNTSKWDTIGINNIEANACGIPVITTNAPPMNELIRDKVNGLTVKGVTTEYEYVTCPAVDIDVDELAKAMMVCKNEEILDCLQHNARAYAEEHFDWDKNKQVILKLFDNELNGDDKHA